MTNKQHRHLKLRRILTPLLGLGLALPGVVCSQAAKGQAAPAAPRTPATRPTLTPELKGRNVEDVRILGNTTVSYTIIRNLIRTQVGQPFDPATAEDDYQRIFDLKKFANVQARVEPTQSGGVIVVFQVTEEKLIRSITFHGNRAINSDTIKDAIDIKDRQAVDTFRISLARQSILNLYRDHNFPMARVDVPGDSLARGELVFDIVEGPQVRIRNIDFIGVHSFTKGKLNDQIKTGTYFFIFNEGKYDAEQVDDDVASIRRFYESKGFFDVKVDRKLIFSPDNSELEIDFVIDEGRRYVVNSILFSGNSKVTDAALRSNFKLQPGMTFDQELVDRDRKQVVSAYSKFGYIYQPNSSEEDYFRVEPKPIFLAEPGKVDVVYDIHEGKPFKLGQIFVRGNYKSMDKLVLREFRDVTPGTTYDSGEVQAAMDRLKGLPYFGSVTVNPIGDDPNYRDLLVEVTEGRTASFNVGAGINSNGGIGGNITYRQNNFDIANVPDDLLTNPSDALSEHAFTGAGQQFVASFEPGTIATNATLRFSEPYLFDLPYTFSNEIYLQDRVREAYDDRRYGDHITFGKRFDYVWSAALTLRAEGVKIYQVQDYRFRSEQILDAMGDHALTGAAITVRRETINPGFLPYQGSVTNFGYEYVGAMGGDYNFHKFTINHDQYFTIHNDLLDRRTVLGLHGFVGYIPGESPFFERFYGGGIGSIRGFLFRGVGPRDGRGNDPVGGNFAFTGSAEVNFPIYQEALRGVVFTDFGDVESEARIGTIRDSVGAGVRLILPFLGQTPLAIDFAVPTVKARGDNTQLISFSLGWSP